jgi:peptidylprolyl isomerase
MKRATTAIALLALIFGLSACSSQPESTIASTPVPATVLPSVSGALNQAPTITKPAGAAPSSLEIRDIAVGTGATVAATSTVTVQYTGLSWSDGQTFDSSWQRGQAATFALSKVIPGWQQGLLGMQVGGRRLVVIPPSLGYGASGSGSIKPNETLIFVVDLLAVS